jgi:hypothetical protein
MQHNKHFMSFIVVNLSHKQNTFLTPEADLYMKLLHDKRELCQEF